MPRIKEILQRYSDAKGIRSQSDDLRMEAGRYVWPTFQDMFQPTETAGQQRRLNIFDSTAIDACLRMTSGIFSFLMPVGAKWHEFKSSTAEENEVAEIQEWLSKASAATHSEIWKSNFQREMFMTIRSLGTFGTGAISVEKDKITKEIIFRNYHIADIFFEENVRGQVDVVFRRMYYTVRQAVQEFGLENLSKKLQDKFNKGKFSEKFEFVHAVYPREDYDPTKIDAQGKRFEGKYIEIDTKKLVQKDAFVLNPYFIGRFTKAPNELMGRSPATEFLPEIKMLNQMRKTFIEQAEYEANPAMLIEDDCVIGQPSTGAGDNIYIRPGAQVPTPWQKGTSSALTAEIINDQRQIIRDGFFNDLFSALAQFRNMTATEVVERVEEKMVLLAPIISALQKELFDPIITRVLELINDGKRLVSPPQDIDIDVVYQGRLALAMSNMQTNAIEITLAKWTPYAELGVMENVDLDKSFRRSWINSGSPAEDLRPIGEVKAERLERQRQAEAAQLAEVGETASKAIRNVSGEEEQALLESLA